MKYLDNKYVMLAVGVGVGIGIGYMLFKPMAPRGGAGGAPTGNTTP